MNFLNELQLNSFKGVPALPPTPLGLLKLGSQVAPKNMQKRWQKEDAKVTAKRQKVSAPNPNPLAPAQSKHTFPFSEQT